MFSIFLYWFVHNLYMHILMFLLENCGSCIRALPRQLSHVCVMHHIALSCDSAHMNCSYQLTSIYVCLWVMYISGLSNNIYVLFSIPACFPPSTLVAKSQINCCLIVTPLDVNILNFRARDSYSRNRHKYQHKTSFCCFFPCISELKSVLDLKQCDWHLPQDQ